MLHPVKAHGLTVANQLVKKLVGLLAVPQRVWREVKGEAMAVDEADYTSVFVRTVGPEERQ